MFGFHVHDWSPFALPIDTHTGHKQQWRRCKTCGLADFKTLPWCNQPKLLDVLESLKTEETE